MLAQVLDVEQLSIAQLVVDAVGDADPAHLADALHARRDVHAVAEHVVARLGLAKDDVADVDADAQLEVGFAREGALDLDRAGHRLDGARKGAERPVAHLLHPVAVELPDQLLLHGPAARDRLDRELLVLPHRRRVAGDVAEQDGDDLAGGLFHGWRARL